VHRTARPQNDPIKFCSYAKSAADTKIITCDVAGRVHVWSTVVEVINSLLRRWARLCATGVRVRVGFRIRVRA